MDPRRARTIDALLTAAEAVFAEQSLDEVTVEQIAARAGVAVSSIYNHFGSKAGLHAAVVERVLDVDQQHMDRAYRDDLSAVEQIEAAALEYLAFSLEHPDHFRMLAFPPDPGHFAAGQATVDTLARRVAEQNERLVDAISRGIDAGQLRPIDPELAATALWAAWNGILSLAWRPDELRRDPAGLRQLLDAATDMVRHGLLRTP